MQGLDEWAIRQGWIDGIGVIAHDATDETMQVGGPISSIELINPSATSHRARKPRTTDSYPRPPLPPDLATGRDGKNNLSRFPACGGEEKRKTAKSRMEWFTPVTRDFLPVRAKTDAPIAMSAHFHISDTI